MLDLDQVNRIVTETAAANFGKENVSRVASEITTDWVGEEALRILIVFPGNSIPQVSGEAIISNLAEISRKLQENGDERFPILSYATEDELANELPEDELSPSGDTES